MAINGEVDGDGLVMEQVERPDIEGSAGHVDAARRLCGDAHE